MQLKWSTIWTNKVCRSLWALYVCVLTERATIDQEWLDAMNRDRKKEQIDQVTYEMFEVIMDRLEKEWFDLVR